MQLKTLNISRVQIHHWERIKRGARDGIWLIAGQAATVLGNLVLVRVLTQYMSPAEYGQLALVLTILALVNQIVMSGLITGIPRFYVIAKEKNDLFSYVKASTQLLSWGSLAIACFGIALAITLIYLDRSTLLIQLGCVLGFSILNSLSFVLFGILNAARKRPLMALHLAADAWLKVVFCLIAIFSFGVSISGVITAYAVSALVVIFSKLRFLELKPAINSLSKHQETSKYWLAKIWSVSWPFSVWGLFTWAQVSSDRWALERFTTTHEVGEYVVLYQIGFVPMGIIGGILVSYMTPVLYDRYGLGENSKKASGERLAWLASALSLVIMLVAFIGTYVLHDFIFRILVAAPFRSSSYLLPWIVLAGGLFATVQTLGLKLMSELRLSSMVTSKISTAVIGTGLNFYGAWKFKTAGVVAALIVFSILNLVWTFWLAKQTRYST